MERTGRKRGTDVTNGAGSKPAPFVVEIVRPDGVTAVTAITAITGLLRERLQEVDTPCAVRRVLARCTEIVDTVEEKLFDL
jgi:hypothetical protein